MKGIRLLLKNRSRWTISDGQRVSLPRQGHFSTFVSQDNNTSGCFLKRCSTSALEVGEQSMVLALCFKYTLKGCLSFSWEMRQISWVCVSSIPSQTSQKRLSLPSLKSPQRIGFVLSALHDKKWSLREKGFFRQVSPRLCLILKCWSQKHDGYTWAPAALMKDSITSAFWKFRRRVAGDNDGIYVNNNSSSPKESPKRMKKKPLWLLLREK